jgi:hypothetical protein
MNSNSEYLSEVLPVAAEKKTLTLRKRSMDCVAFGFDASFEEIADFYQRTYVWGSTKIACLKDRPDTIGSYTIFLGAECLFHENGDWEFGGNLWGACDVWVTAFAVTGEIRDTFSMPFLGHEDDLFRYFGLELLPEIEKFYPFLEESFAASAAVKAKMKQAESVDMRVVVSELSEQGKLLIDAAKLQSPTQETLLTPVNGELTVKVWESGESPSESVFSVRLLSKLLWRERSLRYGMEWLPREDFSQWSEFGGCVPTEACLVRMEAENRELVSPWKEINLRIPRFLVEEYLLGTMTGAEVLNKFWETVHRYCKDGEMELR